LNHTLAENELKTQQKKEVIYKDWLCYVYEPLKREITKIKENNYEQETHLRDLNYVEYLRQVNTRGAVYQDDYDPNDYNPFKHLIRQNSKKSKTRKLIANIHERKLQKENSIISNFESENENKRLLSLRCKNTRSDINWDQWLKEKYNDIESTERIKSGYA
jgi:HD superfamily phosphohydrolase